MLPWKRNNTFPMYPCWPTCNCQQYKTAECCHGNARMGSNCTVAELQTASYCCPVYCPIVLSDFNQIRSFSTDFRPQYQISWQSVLIHAMEQTDGHDANRSFQRLARTRLKIYRHISSPSWTNRTVFKEFNVGTKRSTPHDPNCWFSTFICSNMAEARTC